MTGLEHLSDSALNSLVAARIGNPTILDAVVREVVRRGKSEPAFLATLIERWAMARLDCMFADYTGLAVMSSDSDIDTAGEFKRHLLKWAEDVTARFAMEDDPIWPWPVTEVLPSKRKGDYAFENELSALRYLGYVVGKTNGMRDHERRKFLDYFFTHSLPAEVDAHFEHSYGAPGSSVRLRKMADVIAANCRNFKRNDRKKYVVAIRHWEQDLAYLKKAYYKAGSFPWPPVE